ncbi:GIY-YIG nuclease family protein [Methylocystis sp.]|uniref:GIY-YIG nuclease family protein n=1 Tax=Methylocystis sp. TaxID=1911079 RepID=UPI002732F4F3|nr:GIY-YIG nuclease family protein [Methylocystis sp.]MDP3554860.1 GIY-YIG nuclease family protein [Methylocystis sp.]
MDFKDAQGNWLPLQIALEEAAKLNKQAELTRVANSEKEAYREPPQRRPRSVTRGYVYFMFCANHVKIGFSKNPARRMREMGTARAEDVKILIAAQATQHQERLVQEAMRTHHFRGEWFRADDEIFTFAIDCAKSKDVNAALNHLARSRVRTKPGRICDIRPPLA